ncbi:Mlp family lipoprotein (plasmid) [Borrelia miyamotoi]|uniref:Mlp family lipoprotein n=2 Tax=Borrelia miyamotoi TaxID=47466 RepID=A0AAQ3HE07_9SPIR|nr:Mlp family lipoprotein [Borrelia miyamotoi]ATQ15344.2 Mlp family lipoprotein [Borrelia miyamotoi]ATQ16528.2 Mlp family lipoprotein [Borrelia miyamotoi]ATQ17674.2 Mlp family lipoprotein [Borrelia miyamotoi]ATQ18874.2 Mlp family lipoprotein [Borrelia miyamotoi]ATQ20168.2 Mlp family lipoprotein [Borrelia miyamotoi]
MVKFIYYLIMSCTLLLYCCLNRNPMPEGTNPNNDFNSIKGDPHIYIDINTTLAEEEVFSALKSGFDTIITNTPKGHKKTKYNNFITWLSNNPQKKKELANAFTIVYNFLDDRRKRQSSNLTTEQLIINTLKCCVPKPVNAICNDNNHAYQTIPDIDGNDLQNALHLNFTFLLQDIFSKNSNEEIFKITIDNLREPFIYIANFIGTDRLEQIIRQNHLNDSQKQGLDLLKAALNDKGKFHQFLRLDKDELKEILNHIYSELEKCGRDDSKKDTFKNAIKNYFNIITERKLDKFVDQVTSSC